MKTGPLRLLYLCLGFLALAFGMAGFVLPVMPTVPFLIVAAWAFARSSRRFHDWLYNHRLFGPLLVNWDRHRVIPPLVKAWACLAMAGSVGLMVLAAVPGWVIAGVATVMTAVAVYIVTRPGRVPEGEKPATPPPARP